MIELDEGKVYAEITRLNKVQFPLATVNDFCNKGIGELREVLTAPKSKRLGEFADSMICVMAGASKDGYSYEELWMAIAAKTTVNQRRKFVRLENGTYQHVEGE